MSPSFRALFAAASRTFAHVTQWAASLSTLDADREQGAEANATTGAAGWEFEVVGSILGFGRAHPARLVLIVGRTKGIVLGPVADHHAPAFGHNSEAPGLR